MSKHDVDLDALAGQLARMAEIRIYTLPWSEIDSLKAATKALRALRPVTTREVDAAAVFLQARGPRPDPSADGREPDNPQYDFLGRQWDHDCALFCEGWKFAALRAAAPAPTLRCERVHCDVPGGCGTCAKSAPAPVDEAATDDSRPTAFDPSGLADDLCIVRAMLQGWALEWTGEEGEEDDGDIAVGGAPLFKAYWPDDFPCNVDAHEDDDVRAKQVRETHALARVIVAATNAALREAELGDTAVAQLNGEPAPVTVLTDETAEQFFARRDAAYAAVIASVEKHLPDYVQPNDRALSYGFRAGFDIANRGREGAER